MGLNIIFSLGVCLDFAFHYFIMFKVTTSCRIIAASIILLCSDMWKPPLRHLRVVPVATQYGYQLAR